MKNQECVAVLQRLLDNEKLRIDTVIAGCPRHIEHKANIEALTAAIDALQRQGEIVVVDDAMIQRAKDACCITMRDGTKAYFDPETHDEWHAMLTAALPPQPPTGEQK